MFHDQNAFLTQCDSHVGWFNILCKLQQHCCIGFVHTCIPEEIE